MGISDLLIEQWAAEPVEVEVSFLCPVCGHPSAAWLKVPGDDDDYVDEVSCLNPETDHEWTVRLRRKNGYRVGSVEGHPGVGVSIKELDTSDDWDEPEPEPDAYGIFRRAMADWKSNVRELGTSYGASSRNRMLFVTLYSILEAYLSDAIIGAAMEDVAVQRKMLKLDGLKDKQVSLVTILDKPDIVKEMVKTTLQGLSFHKLGAINGICESCFGKKMLPRDSDDRTLIMKSIDKRHDCVHRNGADKAGALHDDITREYLDKIGELFEEMAETLDGAMGDLKVQKYLDNLDEDDMRSDQ